MNPPAPVTKTCDMAAVLARSFVLENPALGVCVAARTEARPILS
jgi:hypothetical protein